MRGPYNRTYILSITSKSTRVPNSLWKKGLIMPLILILVILLLAFGGGGYYMGPGVGYYGGGTIDLIIILVILYLLFGRGRTRL
jgi:hypothetical protein